MASPYAKALAWLICSCLPWGCNSDEGDVLQEFAGPRLAAESAASSHTQRYVIGPDAELQLKASQRKTSASATLRNLNGYLELSPIQLGSLRGELRADLRSLSQVEGPLAASEILSWFGGEPATRRARLLVVRFVIRKVLSSSVEALHLARPQRGASGQFAEARVEVLGDLSLHGYRAEQRVELVLRVPLVDRVPNFKKLELRTARPAKVALGSYRLEAELPRGSGAGTSRVRTIAVEARLPLRAVE